MTVLQRGSGAPGSPFSRVYLVQFVGTVEDIKVDTDITDDITVTANGELRAGGDVWLQTTQGATPTQGDIEINGLVDADMVTLRTAAGDTITIGAALIVVHVPYTIGLSTYPCYQARR